MQLLILHCSINPESAPWSGPFPSCPFFLSPCQVNDVYPLLHALQFTVAVYFHIVANLLALHEVISQRCNLQTQKNICFMWTYFRS